MKKTDYGQLLLVLTVIFIFSGCDQVKTIKDYFSGKKSGEAVEETQSTPPTEKMATEDKTPETAETTQSLKANELARIGKWAITVDEFKDRIKALKEAVPDANVDDIQTRALVLDELLRQQLVYEDAQKRGLDKNKDVQLAIEEFRRQIMVRQTLSEVVKDLTVTDEDVKAFYEEKKDQLVEPGDWHLREIRVDDNASAEQIRDEIVKGADFAETATQKSKSPSAASGGDLGFMNIKGLPFQEMAQVLMEMKVGDVSPVFQGPYGYYIVKIEEQKQGRQLELDDIKNDLKQNLLLQKQQEAVAAYLKKLAEEIKPQINEDLLKNLN